MHSKQVAGLKLTLMSFDAGALLFLLQHTTFPAVFSEILRARQGSPTLATQSVTHRPTVWHFLRVHENAESQAPLRPNESESTFLEDSQVHFIVLELTLGSRCYNLHFKKDLLKPFRLNFNVHNNNFLYFKDA